MAQKQRPSSNRMLLRHLRQETLVGAWRKSIQFNSNRKLVHAKGVCLQKKERKKRQKGHPRMHAYAPAQQVTVSRGMSSRSYIKGVCACIGRQIPERGSVHPFLEPVLPISHDFPPPRRCFFFSGAGGFLDSFPFGGDSEEDCCRFCLPLPLSGVSGS